MQTYVAASFATVRSSAAGSREEARHAGADSSRRGLTRSSRNGAPGRLHSPRPAEFAEDCFGCSNARRMAECRPQSLCCWGVDGDRSELRQRSRPESSPPRLHVPPRTLRPKILAHRSADVPRRGEVLSNAPSANSAQLRATPRNSAQLRELRELRELRVRSRCATNRILAAIALLCLVGVLILTRIVLRPSAEPRLPLGDLNRRRERFITPEVHRCSAESWTDRASTWVRRPRPHRRPP